MKLDIGQKIGVTMGVLIILFVMTDTLMTKEVSLENTTVVHEHFKGIERFKLRNKSSVSYNIFTEESSTYYKVIPEYISCFDLALFMEDAKEGQAIDIYVNNDNGLRSKDLQSVVGLVVNQHDYISRNCINAEIKSNKIEIPLLILSFIVIGGVVYAIYRKRKKDNVKSDLL